MESIKMHVPISACVLGLKSNISCPCGQGQNVQGALTPLGSEMVGCPHPPEAFSSPVTYCCLLKALSIKNMVLFGLLRA
jgi:hypothetical protein